MLCVPFPLVVAKVIVAVYILCIVCKTAHVDFMLGHDQCEYSVHVIVRLMLQYNIIIVQDIGIYCICMHVG